MFVQCLLHPVRKAVSSCSVCGRAVCDLCLGQIDNVDYCPVHFEIAEARIRNAGYHLPPLPSKAGVPDGLIGIWAVLGAVAPWLSWYRTIVISHEPVSRSLVVSESGWQGGGVSALACVALLASGLTLGIMVGVRLIRPQVISRASIANTSIALGATIAGLLILQGLIRAAASRSLDAGPGLYVASTSAIVCVYLGRRMRRG